MKTIPDLAAFITELLDRGVTLEADGDFLHIAGPLKPSEIERLRECKPEILRILAATDEGVSRASFDAAAAVGQSILARIEARFAKSGRVQFDLSVPETKWDETRFDEQVSQLQDASWWKLGEPRRCSDCRHQERTSHPALVTCSSPEGDHHFPAAGGHWDADRRMCRAWAPTDRTGINSQIQENTR